jgi:hypothetical protein
LEPFYLLVFIAGLLVANLLLNALRATASIGTGRCPYERRDPFLSEQARLFMGAAQQAVGEGYRVLAQVSAASVLQPESGVGRRKRRKGAAALRGRVLDFLVCADSDLYPLCAITIEEERAGRARKAARAAVAKACGDAGLPLVSLALRDQYEITELRRTLREAMATADLRLTDTPNPHQEDEEAALAALAAAMQEPDGPGTARAGRR